MSKRRRLFIYAIIAVIFGGSFYDAVTGREDWPFSPYAMYSHAEEARSLSQLRLFGGLRDEPGKEIPLFDFRYIQPFDQARLSTALGLIEYDPDRALFLESAVKDCLKRYETGRRAALHHGPPLYCMRLYRAEWALDPSAKNVDQPNRRELVIEVTNEEDHL